MRITAACGCKQQWALATTNDGGACIFWTNMQQQGYYQEAWESDEDSPSDQVWDSKAVASDSLVDQPDNDKLMIIHRQIINDKWILHSSTPPWTHTPRNMEHTTFHLFHLLQDSLHTVSVGHTTSISRYEPGWQLLHKPSSASAIYRTVNDSHTAFSYL